jgi:hypothetical protein
MLGRVEGNRHPMDFEVKFRLFHSPDSKQPANSTFQMPRLSHLNTVGLFRIA